MPYYDYKCENCNHQFEERQSFNDASLTKCPECKENKLQRMIGVPTVWCYNAKLGHKGDRTSMAEMMGGRYIPMDSAEQKFEKRMDELENHKDEMEMGQ